MRKHNTARRDARNIPPGLSTSPFPGGHMPSSHSTNGDLVDAAVYYRMSDDKQENSIDRQRSQVQPYLISAST
jgi:hypothetical protein